MNKSTSAKLSIFVAFVLVFGIFSVKENIYAQTTTNSAPNANTMPNTNTATTTSTEAAGTPQTGTQETGSHAAEGQGTVVRDQVTLLLEGKGLPKGDFIELYDSTPFKIVNGHFVAKVPCNANGQSEVDLLTGEAPNFKSSEAELVSALSTPGKLCVYHVDLISDTNSTITDVAIKNNSTKDIVFPPTSSVGVGVNSIAALPHEHE
jgi:hypothetical protein